MPSSSLLLLLAAVSLLAFQPSGVHANLSARIQQLVFTILTTDNEKEEAAAKAEADRIYQERGLPSIQAVGDEAAYQFAVMRCSTGSPEAQQQALLQAREGARLHQIPADAAAYCAAHRNEERAKARAKEQAPSHPGLRDQLEQLYQADQAVRQKSGFDAEKMAQTDNAHTEELEAVFSQYGVPTYRMVGPEAASAFVTMMQHQPAEFRRKVLPRLEAAVRAGQAAPSAYAMMFDRLRTDAGRKQRYGENLVCDRDHPQLHVAPIEDERHVNQRRAEVGLLRLDLYARLVVQFSPNLCAQKEAK